MFHHIVMLNLKGRLEQADSDYIAEACEEMRRTLPGVISLDFVRNVSDRSPAYTHAFSAIFVDSAAHDLYQEAPIHGPLRDKVREIADHLIVLDYET